MATRSTRNEAEVRRKLFQEFGGRCSYCGITLGANEGNVDRFYPRRQYPELDNDPLNLVLACNACNVRKRDKFPQDEDGRPLLLHPRFSFYDDHIRFGSDGSAHPLTASGKATIDTFVLNRPELVLERQANENGSRNPIVMATAALARTHSAGDLASALFASLNVDGRTEDSEVIARLIRASGIGPTRGSIVPAARQFANSRAERYRKGRRSYQVIDFDADADDADLADYDAAPLIAALLFRLRQDGHSELATNVVKNFEPQSLREVRPDDRTTTHIAATPATTHALPVMVHSPRDGDFDVGQEVGRGMFGTVYEGRDLKLGRRVAIKIVRESGELVLSALAQARVLARANHPNVITIYSFARLMDPETSQMRDAIIMEFVEGSKLSERLKGAVLDVEEVKAIGNGVVDGLEHLHNNGLVHQDLHEDNVLLMGRTPKLIDPMHMTTLADLSPTARETRIRGDLANLKSLLGDLLANSSLDRARWEGFCAVSGRGASFEAIRRAFEAATTANQGLAQL